MKIPIDKKLFWFLKEGVQLDLSQPSELDMYVQQTITYGHSEDIRRLLKKIDLKQFQTSISRLKRFLPLEVKKFWEDFLAGH